MVKNPFIMNPIKMHTGQTALFSKVNVQELRYYLKSGIACSKILKVGSNFLVLAVLCNQ